MKQVILKLKLILGIRDEKARMKVTPPLAVAPIAQEDDICDGTRMTTALFSTLKGAARPITTASMHPQHSRIPQESSKFFIPTICALRKSVSL